MAFSYDRYERTTTQRRGGVAGRSALGYWVPLVITVITASAGIAAWIWSERRDHEESDEDYDTDTEYARRFAQQRQNLQPGFDGQPPTDQRSFEQSTESREEHSESKEELEHLDVANEEGFFARVSGAMRRTPSPQQMMEGAGKRVAAGMAVVGKGLTSITEEQRDDYVDHERWSEEAESREKSDTDTVIGPGAAALATTGAIAAGTLAGRSRDVRSPPAQSRGSKRLVAIVVSADSTFTPDEDDSSYHIEHAVCSSSLDYHINANTKLQTLLSHLPPKINLEVVQLLVLVYAPHLESHPLASSTSNPLESPPSTASSYEDISNPGATPDNMAQSYTNPSTSKPSSLYTALTTQALSLTAHPTCILPFTAPAAHIHLLRQLAPSTVYIQENLCGSAADGDIVKQISGWVGQVVVVVGAEGAGLIDTETEDEGGDQARKAKWWQDERRVGLGKGVEVVESMRLGDDWEKRVGM